MCLSETISNKLTTYFQALVSAWAISEKAMRDKLSSDQLFSCDFCPHAHQYSGERTWILSVHGALTTYTGIKAGFLGHAAVVMLPESKILGRWTIDASLTF